MMTGREGEGGGGGEYDGKCLFDDDSYDNEYDDENKYGKADVYDDAEDGKGSRGGADDGGIQLRRSRRHPRAVLWWHGA